MRLLWIITHVRLSIFLVAEKSINHSILNNKYGYRPFSPITIYIYIYIYIYKITFWKCKLNRFYGLFYKITRRQPRRLPGLLISQAMEAKSMSVVRTFYCLFKNMRRRYIYTTYSITARVNMRFHTYFVITRVFAD